MNVSERIEKSGKGNVELSEEIGVPVSTVWRWRKKGRTPDARYVLKLAQALNCQPVDIRPDLAELFGYAEKHDAA